MSCNAYMDVTVTVNGEENFDELHRWADRHHQLFELKDGKAVAYGGWEASWFDSAIEDLEKTLSELDIPLDKWTASVWYEYYDEPFDDGSEISFEIEDGEIRNYMESRFEMVMTAPGFRFNFKDGKEEA